MSENPCTVPYPDEGELRFRTLFDAAGEFIFVIDPEGHIKLTNRHVCEQSGYKPAELAGKHIKEFFTETSKQLCDCNFPKLLSSGHTRAETEFACKDGRILQMECLASAIPDRHGAYTSFLVIQRDISERKRAAEELAGSERKFRAIFNSTLQFIGMLSPDGTLLEANKSALEAANVTAEEVVGKPFWDTAWWSGLEDEQERLKAAVARAAGGEMVRYETIHTDRDGNVMHIDFSLKPVKNELGETVLIVPEGRDITARRQAEEIACQHQRETAHLMRLSIMGEMAASIAHELNQPLTALISYCGTAMTQLEDVTAAPDSLRDILARANQQAHRASDIIQHIRSFVSKGTASKQRVTIDQVILDMSRLLDWERRNIEVDLDLSCTGHSVVANSVQIEQVLLNLARNSIEAIQNAGIEHGRLVLQSRTAGDRSMVISVADNGPGIEAGMREHLFEPFHTSKEEGMGMGLSISRSIIQSHQGKIWLEKSGPEGTEFRILLPLHRHSHD